MKFKDFQTPVLFSSTFDALNLAEKKTNTFKDFQGCMGTLCIINLHYKTREEDRSLVKSVVKTNEK